MLKDPSCVTLEVRKNIDLMGCLKLFAQTETLSKDDAWYVCSNHYTNISYIPSHSQVLSKMQRICPSYKKI